MRAAPVVVVEAEAGRAVLRCEEGGGRTMTDGLMNRRTVLRCEERG